ncbi:MAG: ATP-dependent DNA helicase Hel308 [Candidatus Micrarchaeota archaeon]|nr:MAG: ATP-dependent DNA helicase Hel308 [Candidatus Micrarchaeota archaeon]
MNIADLAGKLPREILEAVYRKGIVELTEPQELAIKKGLLDFKNIVVASPTASGKTFIGELAALNNIIKRRKKSVYIAPLRALVTEKYKSFLSSYPFIKSAYSIGDLDSAEPDLANYDMIFLSTEKFDSIIRHGADWIYSIGCVIFDEIHALDDISRGPTLEILITKMKRIDGIQIVGLSATIGNAKELADWLDAELVQSSYRPVRLRKGVAFDSKIIFDNSEEYRLTDLGKIEHSIIYDTLMMKKQTLLFLPSRRSAEAAAKELSDLVYRYLTAEEKEKLKEIAYKVYHVLDKPTDQCELLSKLVEKGVAFHHAGLLNRQRELIEDSFREGLIKVITTTTTLSMGIDLPAHTVIIKNVNRYDSSLGSSRLSVNEVLQIFGRAGRPRYDKEGRGIICAPNEYRASELFSLYINAEPEDIESKLAVQPLLREHILSLVASNEVSDMDQLKEFIGDTFYAHRFGNTLHIRKSIERIINDLIDYGMLEVEGKSLNATKLGKRVSDLYIDPMSGYWIKRALESISSYDDLSLLFIYSATMEMRPLVKTKSDLVFSNAMYELSSNQSIKRLAYLDAIPRDIDEVDILINAFMLYDWINEIPERDISDRYDIAPGVLYNKIKNLEWISYSAIEIAKIINRYNAAMRYLDMRISEGVKEELLDLVRLKGIGRIRARLLYDNGIRNVKDILEHRESVEKLLGKEIAKKIIDSINL